MMSRAATSILAASVLAVLSSAPSAARTNDRDAEFAASVAAARAAVPAPKTAAPAAPAAGASAAKVPAACPDAKELETAFDVRLVDSLGRATDLRFEYADCSEEPRNDYLPPYTERSYKGPDSYALTIVTDEGKPGSDVLLSRANVWVGRFGYHENARLVSGERLAGGEVVVAKGRDQIKYQASLRAASGTFARTRVCDEGVRRLVGSAARDADGRVSTGFGRGGPGLVLLTAAKAYYYHEDCDICAELDECDLDTGATRAVITAHGVSCSDIAPYRPERGELYSACDGVPR